MKSFALISIVLGASLAHAEIVVNARAVGARWQVRDRGAARGGWTDVAFEGTLGSTLVNAQSAAVQSTLRLVDQNSKQIYPVEPRPVAKGSRNDYVNEVNQRQDELGELEREDSEVNAATAGIDAKLREARALLKTQDQHADALAQIYRAAEVLLKTQRDQAEALDQIARAVKSQVQVTIESKDGAALLNDLNQKANLAATASLRTRFSISALEAERTRTLESGRAERAGRLSTLKQQITGLAGFYVDEPNREIRDCARPWTFESSADAVVNPFYLNPAAAVGSARPSVCVNLGRVQATYLLSSDRAVIAKVLYGWDKEGRVNRVRILDPRGEVLEDHQFWPGPNQTVRYVFTFRGDRGLTSVYTDL